MDALIQMAGLPADIPPDMLWLVWNFRIVVTLLLLAGSVDIVKGITFRLSKGGF